jgi:AraC-like DNA-binding protein
MQASRESPEPSGPRLPDLSALRSACPDRRMREAVDFLLAHDLKQEFRTEELSRRLALSTRRVLHLFHHHLKFSPAQIIKARRLEEARNLFATSWKGVKEVMVEVGFNDFSHFVRDIKWAYGKTPSELRKESGKENTADENGNKSGR